MSHKIRKGAFLPPIIPPITEVNRSRPSARTQNYELLNRLQNSGDLTIPDANGAFWSSTYTNFRNFFARIRESLKNRKKVLPKENPHIKLH